MKAHTLPLIALAGLLLLASCTKKDDTATNDQSTNNTSNISDTPVDQTDAEILAAKLNLPTQLFNYANQPLPNYLTNGPVDAADNTPLDNPITDAGATLGRVLFYDKMLSANNTIACASCHKQANGFSDDKAFSLGFEGGSTDRNSMGLTNARFYQPGHFFWDERANTLEDQVLMPIQSTVEMGLTLQELVNRVQAQDYYQVLFRMAFGDSTVTSERISDALAQFVRSIVSYQSKYDEGLQQTGNAPPGGPGGNQNLPNFTALENQGLQLFFSGRAGNCAACHGTTAFVAPAARNNGLDLVNTDKGVGGVNGNPNDEGKFKVPSLKNIGLTAPYMHDGRFATLEEVIEHYNSGVQANPNLDNRLMRNGQPQRLNLTDQEKEALVAFLNTLTDYSVITDEKFSDPFVIQ